MCKQARYLGFLPDAEGHLGAELAMRTLAGRRAWRWGGSVWLDTTVPRRARRMSSSASSRTPLSNLSLSTPSKVQLRRLDRLLLPWLRSMSSGSACFKAQAEGTSEVDSLDQLARRPVRMSSSESAG